MPKNIDEDRLEIQMKSLIGEKEFREYKDFALRDDMFKLAVGVMLGNSFNKVVYGISDYIVMPIFKFLVSKTGDEWRNWSVTPAAGLTFELGRLCGTVVDFILISILLYLLYIKLFSRILITSKERHDLKSCPLCCTSIRNEAIKCPACTGDLNVKPRRTRTKNKGTKNRRGK